jgi:hypothetical protein
VSVRDADGRSFSTVAAGMVIAEGSVSFPQPWNSTLILLFARPGPEPIEIVHPSTAQPVKSRSMRVLNRFGEGVRFEGILVPVAQLDLSPGLNKTK